MSDTIRELEAEEMAEKPFNAAEPEEVNEARKRAGRRKAKGREVIKALMNDVDGRAWIYGLLVDSAMFGDPTVQGDPYMTYKNIGMQNFGKRIWQDVELAAPDECALMMKEARSSKQ